MIGVGGGTERTICSRAGCAADARWMIEWRNPRIHDEGRVKVWTACDDHVEFLREFLSARSFPLSVRELQPR